jgi:TonB family protein
LPNQMTGHVNDFGQKMRIIFIQDSLGVISVKDGNGHAKEKVSELKGDILYEEGDYKDGFKDGIWTGKHTNNAGTYYTEIYQMGKFISGESMQDGKSFTYTVSEAPPEFRGGMKAWYEFIGRTTSYPKAALDDRVTGTVYASFVIDKEGRVTDIKITKSVHEALDKEAVRVLQQSPRWKPGQQKGMPVKVTYNQSFKFNAS